MAGQKSSGRDSGEKAKGVKGPGSLELERGVLRFSPRDSAQDREWDRREIET